MDGSNTTEALERETLYINKRTEIQINELNKETRKEEKRKRK